MKLIRHCCRCCAHTFHTEPLLLPFYTPYEEKRPNFYLIMSPGELCQSFFRRRRPQVGPVCPARPLQMQVDNAGVEAATLKDSNNASSQRPMIKDHPRRPMVPVLGVPGRDVLGHGQYCRLARALEHVKDRTDIVEHNQISVQK